MVMLLGQYSTGKTTFIKHLLKSSYPGNLPFFFSSLPILVQDSLGVLIFYYRFTGAHIGPEPTTDRFVVVMVCYWKSFIASSVKNNVRYTKTSQVSWFIK